MGETKYALVEWAHVPTSYYRLVNYEKLSWVSTQIVGSNQIERMYSIPNSAIFLQCSSFGALNVVFFEDEVGYFNCHPSCQTCHSTSMSASDCRTCRLGEILQADGTCSYDCHSSCDICRTLTDCIRCKIDSHVLDLETGSCCPYPLYFDENTGSCTSCHFTCQTCTAFATRCKVCTAGLSQNSHSKECYLECAENQYTINFLSCLTCHTSCKSCANDSLKTSCLSCHPGYLLSNGKCLKICSSSQYYIEASNTCLDCDPSCKTCFKDGIDGCLSCRPVQRLIQNKCKRICTQREFIDPISLDCKSCHQFCRSCFGELVTNCNSCIENTRFIEEENKCEPICNIDQFIERENCKNCDSSCKTCSGETSMECTSCSNDFKILNGECLCQLGEGYFIGENYFCEKCDLSCKTCDKFGETGCTECQKGYYKSKLGNSDREICSKECSNGLFGSKDKKCEECPKNCKSCKNISIIDEATLIYQTNIIQCTICEDKFLIHDNQCIEKCPQNFSSSKNGKKCEICSESCKSCLDGDQNTCTSCYENKVLLDGQCLNNCPESYFKNSQSNCEKCRNSCLKCTSTSNCQLCKNNYQLLKGLCLSNCPKYYAPNSQGVCIPLPCSQGSKPAKIRVNAQNVCQTQYSPRMDSAYPVLRKMVSK